MSHATTPEAKNRGNVSLKSWSGPPQPGSVHALPSNAWHMMPRDTFLLYADRFDPDIQVGNVVMKGRARWD
jgi:hypothetical protein